MPMPCTYWACSTTSKGIDKAIELISRAVALRPGAFAFHANLAEAYRVQGQFDRAIGCCRMALSLRPNYQSTL